MSGTDKTEYYNSTENRPVRSDLLFALEHLNPAGVAIDCGCGAGSDIAFLRSRGFTVHAFDIDPESVSRCEKRFRGDHQVNLSQGCFSTFVYPQSSLVVADASLFFCPPSKFDEVWQKISTSLLKGGVFCGSFLGPRDTMARSEAARLWQDLLVLDEAKIRDKLAGFDILRWTEHEYSGETKPGSPHDWHIFSVVAIKA